MMTPSSKETEESLPQREPPDEGREDEEEEEEILPYAMNYLTPTMEEEARIQLNETEEVRQKALDKMKRLIEGERNLVTPTDDIFLLAFLRARKFKVKKAFKMLQNYFAFRREYRDIFENLSTSAVKELIYRNFVGYLHNRSRKGSVVLICKIGGWDPEVDSFESLFCAVGAVLVHSIKFPATQVAGYQVILDARELSWSQMKYCTPSNILLLIRSTQYCFPARYKCFHILSENKLFHLLWSICSPLLTSKIRKRIVFHGSDLSELLEHVHPLVLPDEFGGKGGSFDNSGWMDIIDKSESEMMEMLNYGYRD